MAISEYDAFGPWIYEITDEHPVPPLFKGICPPGEDALMQLKFPREIERRNATPDMDLYDYIVSADESAVTILARRDREVDRTEVRYAEVQAIRIYRRFLRGILGLYTSDGAVEVPFNTVSIALVMKLVRIMRKRYLPGDGKASSGHLPHGIDGLESFKRADVLFRNLIRDLKAEGEGLIEGAYQPSVPLVYCGTGFKEKLKNRMEKPMLQSAAHLVTAQELIVIEREKTDKKSRQSYGYEYLYVPLDNLKGTRLKEGSEYKGVDIIGILAGNECFNYNISADNRDIRGFYEGLNP